MCCFGYSDIDGTSRSRSVKIKIRIFWTLLFIVVFMSCHIALIVLFIQYPPKVLSAVLLIGISVSPCFHQLTRVLGKYPAMG